MTEQEQKLIENLTKQLELSNKIALKQLKENADSTLQNERLNGANLAYTEAKASLCKKASNLLEIISTIIVLLTILVIIGIISGFGACASIF